MNKGGDFLKTTDKIKNLYLHALKAYSGEVSLKGLNPTVVPDDLSLEKLYVPGYLYSRRLIKKPAPMLYDKNGLAVIDAAFPIPGAESQPITESTAIGSQGVHRIISCISGDGATSLLKILADSIITEDTSLTGQLYKKRDNLFDYFPVFIDALAYTPGEDFDSRLYSMAQAVVETGLSPQQFYDMLCDEKVLLLIDNAGKLKQEKLYSFLNGLKNSAYSDFIISLYPSLCENESVLEILEKFGCRYEITADSISYNEGRLVSAYSIFNNAGRKSERTKIRSVRGLLYKHYFPDVSARFILQTYITNSSQPLSEFQLLHLYFTKEFPMAYHNTYTDIQDVLFILPFIAGAEWKTPRPMTKDVLYSIIKKCSPFISTDTENGGCEKIADELVNTFGLLDESDGIYRFEHAMHMCYFGAMALINRKGININSYLDNDSPDFNLLVHSAGYAFSQYSTYPDAHQIIDFTLAELKSFTDKYPHMIKYFDIADEIGDHSTDRTRMGSLMYLLINTVKEFSPLLPKEKVHKIYSTIFRFHGTEPSLDDFFDLRQCYLEEFCMNNYTEFPPHASRAYIAALIKQGLNPYTILSQHIIEEQEDARRRFMAYTLAVAVRLYNLNYILRLFVKDIPPQLSNILRGLTADENDEYRLCLENIENQENNTGFLFPSDFAESRDEYHFRNNISKYADILISPASHSETEDYFAATLITDNTLACYKKLNESQLTAIHKKYTQLYDSRTDGSTALRYYKILALTGRWEKNQLITELERLDERFSADDSFSWDNIGAETTPEELLMLKNPPAIVTWKRIKQQLNLLSV